MIHLLSEGKEIEPPTINKISLCTLWLSDWPSPSMMGTGHIQHTTPVQLTGSPVYSQSHRRRRRGTTNSRTPRGGTPSANHHSTPTTHTCCVYSVLPPVVDSPLPCPPVVLLHLLRVCWTKNVMQRAPQHLAVSLVLLLPVRGERVEQECINGAASGGLGFSWCPP